MNVNDRVGALRQQMKRYGIDLYVVPTSDYHQSEYVGEYFKVRAYLTGFTGSSGTAVVSQDECCLWTDGRYFIQAEQQLTGSEILLKKMGEPGVEEIETYLQEKLPAGGCIGFDGRCVGLEKGIQYEEIASQKAGKIQFDKDLMDMIWNEREPLSKKAAFDLPETYAGESCHSKLSRIRACMEAVEAEYHLLTGLDDIGWILNLRGQDVEYFPLLLSYLLIEKDCVRFYVDETKLSEKMKKRLQNAGVVLCSYNQIYEDVAKLPAKTRILLDPKRVNYALIRRLPKDIKTIHKENPTILMKAVKNETEIRHIREAHRKDGVACTRFMHWLKTNIGMTPVTEINAADKLEEFRREQEGYLWQSFDPIAAYGPHGAIVHYSATSESNAVLEPYGFLLMDTGGGYMDGSTDITRTFALGRLTPEEKKHFTLVVVSMLRLANAVFPEGCSGVNLDILAREPLWKEGLDYKHGTGHGVGYLGNIHEPPATLNWKCTGTPTAYQENMITTDEPGVYIQGSHGIRIENELLVQPVSENEYGKFLKFEYLTFVPIDLDAIDTHWMEPKDIWMLNEYHRMVRETLSPYLGEEELKWLVTYTRPIV